MNRPIRSCMLEIVRTRHFTLLSRSLVCILIVASEVEIVLNERSVNERVVTDTVAMDDGIYQRKRAEEDDQ